jgi:hypothetical protein
MKNILYILVMILIISSCWKVDNNDIILPVDINMTGVIDNEIEIESEDDTIVIPEVENQPNY